MDRNIITGIKWFTIIIIKNLKCLKRHFTSFSNWWFTAKHRDKYVNWLLMNVLARSLAFSIDWYFVIPRKACNLQVIFPHGSSVWLLNVSSLSILTPSNITSVELSILFLPIFNTKELSFFVPRIINWNLSGFAFNELMLNQAKTLLRSVSRFLSTIPDFVLEPQKVLSSAKVHTSDIVITKNKLFTNILKHMCLNWALGDMYTYIISRAIRRAYFRSLLVGIKVIKNQWQSYLINSIIFQFSYQMIVWYTMICFW